jgi:hypothetical protein
MAFTTAEVNTWFQTIDGLPPTTAGIPANLANAYVAELNSVPPTASEPQIQAQLENQTAPPPNNVATDTFYRTSVAQFVLREFQAAWGVVPNTTQFDAWVARIIANPSLESGGGMSQALAGTQQFLNTYGLQPGQLATTGFINQLLVNLGLDPTTHPGAFQNVGQPVATVLQNFVTSQPVIASLNTPIVNFQNALLAGGTFPTGSILAVGPGGNLNLTTGIDTPTAGFSSGHGATATTAGATFVAAPGTNVLGASNTLNAGDDLEATGAALGNSTLNYTAVASANGNPPVAVGVTMNGVSTAVITNLHAAVAGFSGTITGLTTATEGAGSVGNVRFGTAANALNTALTTVNVNAGHDLTAFMTAAALAAAPTATVNVNGGAVGIGAGADLEVVGSTIGYASLTVNSAGPGGTTTNALTLDTNATNTATITVAGAEAINILAGSTALNIDNLHTFTGAGTTPDTGGITAFFANDDGLGHVAVTGGSGVNTFEFGAGPGGVASFNATSAATTSTVDGGTGATNTLIIDATNGAILLPGVGANITHIATIEHNGDQGAPLTADLSQMGSATTFDLIGAYDNTITVSNITSAQTVEFSGTSPGAADLVLEHAAPAAGQVFNLELSQNLPDGPGGTLDLAALTVALPPALPAGSVQTVNLHSMGNADNNEITDVSGVAANITVDGATHLTFGSAGGAYAFNPDIAAGATINSSAATGGAEVWLGDVAPNASGNPVATFTAGSGVNIAHLLGFGGDTINFSATATNTVDFHNVNFTDNEVSNANNQYNEVNGFAAGNSIDINVADMATALNTFPGAHGLTTTQDVAVAAGDAVNPINFATGTIVDGTTTPAGFNFVNITTPIATTPGETAQTAFNTLMGPFATSHIITAGVNNQTLGSFFDTSNGGQAVYFVDTDATNPIETGDPIAVVGLVHMTQAQYNATAASAIHFT